MYLNIYKNYIISIKFLFNYQMLLFLLCFGRDGPNIFFFFCSCLLCSKYTIATYLDIFFNFENNGF